MATAPSAAVQAELVEKEKSINERQRKLHIYNQQVQQFAQKQVKVSMETRRNTITSNELGKLDENHNVYQALGRTFVKKSVSQMNEDLVSTNKKNEQELAKLSEDKKKLSEHVKTEEAAINGEVEEFMASAKKHGLLAQKQ